MQPGVDGDTYAIYSSSQRIDCFSTDYHLQHSQSFALYCRSFPNQIESDFLSNVLFFHVRSEPGDPESNETQLTQLQLMMIDHFLSQRLCILQMAASVLQD